MPASSSPASKAIDKQLAKYRSMRDFGVTAEPQGMPSRKRGAAEDGAVAALPFVIQKHAATRLHYDFRLGWKGVLKSWAVTKGPSYYPGDKRLAVQVEDHPIEYGGFEGVIPKGEYGGGTVMVWDHGTWDPLVDVDEGLAKGHLKFTLAGEKLRGKWALVRMNGRAANEKKPNWLLIKEHDEYERTVDQTAVTDEAPDSIVTGRGLDAIAAQQDHVWSSSAGKSGTAATKVQAKKELTGNKPTPKRAIALPRSIQEALRQCPREAAPKFLPPQLASPALSAALGSGWVHELKLDGYRVQAHVTAADGDKLTVLLLTRKGLDWTRRMPDVAAQLASLPVKSAVLDGELVVITPTGGTSFALLQAAFQEGEHQPLTYFAFDILHLDGHNLRSLPLLERKRILEELLKSLNSFLGASSCIRFSEHLDSDGREVFSKACELGAEGIVSKMGSAEYVSGRSTSWLKLKCKKNQEFVIGGFTLPANGSHGVGALLLGYYREGRLIYAGRTGTGFTGATHRSLRDRLEKLRREKPAFDVVPAEARRKAQWVTPTLVAEVAFATWTADNLVRQAAFKGLREDKPAKEVVREEPEMAPAVSDHLTARKATPSTVAKPVRSVTSSRVAPYSVRLTHPDKQLDAESKITKKELADYYWAVATHMLPHIASRPLSIVRCPEGTAKPCFFQKHTTENLPAGVESVAVPDRKTGKQENYITLSTAEALVGLAQMGVLEIHPWGSRNDSLETPDRIIFDLDPDASISWPVLAEAAKEVRERLKQFGLVSFVKGTGGKGLHVVAPIDPVHPWPLVKEFARGVAAQMEAGNPRLYLIKMTKSARTDRIYIDYQRNDRGATAVAPYSPRARSGVAVSMPLAWNELAAKSAPAFHVKDLGEWSERLRRDPWKGMFTTRQSVKLPS